MSLPNKNRENLLLCYCASCYFHKTHFFNIFHSLFFPGPDFSISAISNGSQEPQGPGLLKVSGLERSQERSQESCKDSQPPASNNPSQTSPLEVLPVPQPQPSGPRPQSPPWSHTNGPTQVVPPTHLPPRSEAHPQPQTATDLPPVQSRQAAPPPPPRPQHQPELLSYPQPPPRPSPHPHPPSPTLRTHHSHQQHPNQAGPHRPPSRCNPRPLSAYNSINLNGHR